jgi:hypothetical protein
VRHSCRCMLACCLLVCLCALNLKRSNHFNFFQEGSRKVPHHMPTDKLVNRLVPQYSDGFEFARYKRDVMIHAGVLGREGNQQLLMRTTLYSMDSGVPYK